MPTLKLGFALEGNSDYPVIPILAQRIIKAEFPDLEIATSERRLRKTGHGFIKELPSFARQLNSDDDAAIVVAVVDTDNTRINERRTLMREAKDRCSQLSIPVCVADGLAVHSMEAWLLADERAIFQLFDGDRSEVEFHNAEDDVNPKETLNRIVQTLTEGREITFATYARELAEAIRLINLRDSCQHFDDFAGNLINCVREWQRVENPLMLGMEMPRTTATVRRPRKV